jgi:hypothetical protein
MQTHSQLTRTLLIVAVFSLAGYFSAQVFISYSSWVDTLVKANRDKFAPGMYGNAGNPSEAFNGFYRAQAALDKYAVLKWTIFCLEFPVALTLATLLAKSSGWLGHINLWQGVAGVVPVYLIPGPVLFLSGVSWFVLTIPCLAVAALVLALSLKIITSRWSTKLFLGFLLSCAFCCLWGWSQRNVDMAWNVFFISLQMMWAGIFGMGLAIPPNARLQQTRNSVPLISTQPRSH